MHGSACRKGVILTAVLAVLFSSIRCPVRADDLSAAAVLRAIDRAKSFLVSQQQADGSWAADGGSYSVGVTSLVTLALVNGGMTSDERPIQNALKYLRSIREPEPDATYELSLMIMALVAANDGQRDRGRLATLAQRLEAGQVKAGGNAGLWSYNVSQTGGGDRSNGQFGVLGLREAAMAGIPISRATWQRADRHWRDSQNPDGGWGYSGGSIGSMTVAGIATLSITSQMLQDVKEQNPDGSPICCPQYVPDEALEKAERWMARRFAVRTNPGSNHWLLYYLYGLERAGRLSGRRFFGNHDWYREGAGYLIDGHQGADGSWRGAGHIEGGTVVGTSFVLLFLSKGLAPVLVNKLQYGVPDPGNAAAVLGDNWNKHRNDVRNLTEHISGLPRWPKLVTWQVVNMNSAVNGRGVEDLLQAPVLYLSGKDAPQLLQNPAQIELLRSYIEQGGFIFAVANCDGGGDFDAGFRELVQRMYPDGIAQLRVLDASHPIYRSEYLLDPAGARLEGVEFGCRTAIVYSPVDLSCLWERWSLYEPPSRTPQMSAMIQQKLQIGVNVIAYATGREPLNKLDQQELVVQEGAQDQVERGFLQIAKLRHSGQWDAAPQALRNLLLALNRTVGMAASTKQRNLPVSDPNLFKYPLAYMHGRQHFTLGENERKQLKEYLDRGGVLFADACCGSKQFDESFRKLIDQLYPGRSLVRIPAKHELFSAEVGHDLRTVRRRVPDAENANARLNLAVVPGEPFLEGVETDGRFAVIYSKYDISCALERQASVACAGYVPDDALKIAINVILYSLLQDVQHGDALR